jgi:hypothetical protein
VGVWRVSTVSCIDRASASRCACFVQCAEADEAQIAHLRAVRQAPQGTLALACACLGRAALLFHPLCRVLGSGPGEVAAVQRGASRRGNAEPPAQTVSERCCQRPLACPASQLCALTPGLVCYELILGGRLDLGALSLERTRCIVIDSGTALRHPC